MQHAGEEINKRRYDLWHNDTHQGKHNECDNKKKGDTFRLGPITIWILTLISKEYIHEGNKEQTRYIMSMFRR